MRRSLAWRAPPSTGRGLFCLTELLAQMPRHFRVDVVEERVHRDAGKPLGRLDGRRKLGRERGVERGVGCVGTLAEQAQMPSKAIDGILGGPRPLFLGGAVTGGIVARRVGAHTIRDRLDERGAVPRASTVERE